MVCLSEMYNQLHAFPKQLMLEEEQNLEYLQERERSVAQLEADIGDVNQIFKDLAAMVHDQVI